MSDIAQQMKPGEFDAGGKQVVCLHCGDTTFTERATTASTVGMAGSFDILEMVFTLACTGCGYVQWFLKRPKRRQSQAEQRTQPPRPRDREK